MGVMWEGQLQRVAREGDLSAIFEFIPVGDHFLGQDT